MFTVITTTLIAGLIDGLNPISLTQQFILQSKIKSPYHILAFIFANSFVNFIFGLIFYFGFSNWIMLAFNWINHQFPTFWPITSLLMGAFIITYLIYKYRVKDKVEADQVDQADYHHIKNPDDNHLSPISLFMIGAATCVAELSSAAPYLALLGYFATSAITGLQATILLAFYSFILYVLPLYGLFFMSLFFNSKLTTIYSRVAQWLDFATAYILPLVFALIALVLLWYGFNNL
ncbi:hypothetical protein CJ191_07125 [Aerococcus viridans]|uniref:Uncharacterized protein n=1 Tax=Aerococcus viridans TaxID=1377 RepID=A0A2N6UCR6_9LACT|nr:GAP family protein [Aerococcus viridans]PMC79362.1 hypothetical protein CJ191_07125 [Aerococcus viridans]